MYVKRYAIAPGPPPRRPLLWPHLCWRLNLIAALMPETSFANGRPYRFHRCPDPHNALLKKEV